MKNNFGVSGEHKMTLENDRLSPVLEGLSPDLQELSPEESKDLSTKYDETGNTGDTGDKYRLLIDKQGK